MISALGRLERARVKIRDIDAQIEAARCWEDGGQAEIEFQTWRQERLRAFSTCNDEHLMARRKELKASLQAPAWNSRHNYVPQRAQDPQVWRGICEAVLLDYMLGFWPEPSGGAN